MFDASMPRIGWIKAEMWLLVLVLVQGSSLVSGQEPLGITTVQPEELKALIDGGSLDAIIDVRRQDEWDAGRIEGATHMEDLHLWGTSSQTGTTASPNDLMNCEFCTIAAYCNSGARASQALQVLQDNGFVGTLYNGLGVSNWIGAGYSLVQSESVVPPCTFDGGVQEQCEQKYLASTGGNNSTDATPVPAPPPDKCLNLNEDCSSSDECCGTHICQVKCRRAFPQDRVDKDDLRLYDPDARQRGATGVRRDLVKG